MRWNPAFVPSPLRQSISCGEAEAAKDAGTKPLVVGANCGADDAVETIGGGRLERKFTASALQERNELIRDRPDSCHLTVQPIFERRRIDDGGFPKACQGRGQCRRGG